MDKTPLSESFGVEIAGIDARAKLSEEARAFIVAALYEHGAVCLRDQILEPAELQAFGAHFGTPIHHVEEDLRVAGAPGVMVLSNADGRPERQRNGGAFWHTDLVFTDEPASFTMLNAVAVPSRGGETLFADQRAAFAALPERLKARAETAVLAHCYEGRTDGSMPTVHHKLVRPHPATGRRTLYGAAGTCIGVQGMSGTQARGFLDEIGDHASDAKFQYAHFYRLNDLVIWDNAVALHSGPVLEEASGAADTRIMNRVSVRGWPQASLRQ